MVENKNKDKTKNKPMTSQEKFMYAMEVGKRWLIHGGFTILTLVVAAVAIWIAWGQSRDNAVTQSQHDELEAQLTAAKTNLDAKTKDLESVTAQLKQAEEDLSYEKNQVELLNDSTASLKSQVSKLNKEKTELENKIKELLNVQNSKPKITRGQLEEQISAIGELSTLKYIYTNSSRKEGNLTWLWGWTLPFSDSSLLVTYDGTLKAGINLSDIKCDVNENDRIITITLPKSKVLDNYIPQKSINVLEVKDGLFNPVTFDAYNQFITEETKTMEQKAIDLGVLTEADKAARTVVETFLKSVEGIDSYELVFK